MYPYGLTIVIALLVGTQILAQPALPSLDTLQQTYEQQTEKIKDAHRIAEQELHNAYAKAVDELIESARRKGQLEPMIAARAEKERFERERTVPNPSAEGLPEILRAIQNKFNDAATSAQLRKGKSFVALTERYISALDRLMKQYTTENKLDLALEVKAEKERVEFVVADVQAQLDQVSTALSPKAEDHSPPRQSRRSEPTGDLRQGLILHYAFDRPDEAKVVDLSPNANHGTAVGARWCAEGRSLQSKGAYVFDGLPGEKPDRSPDAEHDYILVGRQANGFGLKDFTIAAWFNAQNDRAIIGSGQNELWPRVWWIAPSGFHWFWQQGRASGAVGREGRTLSCSSPHGKWCHIAVTREKNTVTIYVDGRQAAQSSEYPDREFPVYSYGLMIGNLKRDSGRWARWHPFKGAIDEVAIWSRVLSEAEIGQCYRQPDALRH